LSYGNNKYGGSKSEWLALANAYVDLGTWWCVTPFVGAGVGGARVTVSNYTDIGFTSSGGLVSPSSAYADEVSKWNLAWALHAGLAYKISPNVTMELGYRYVDLGNGLTGDVKAYDGGNARFNPTTVQHITSHDLKLGVRWNLEPAPVYAPPLIRKG
jgi:opacity protein-like surface antigen